MNKKSTSANKGLLQGGLNSKCERFCGLLKFFSGDNYEALIPACSSPRTVRRNGCAITCDQDDGGGNNADNDGDGNDDGGGDGIDDDLDDGNVCRTKNILHSEKAI